MVVGCSIFPWKTPILSGLSKHSGEAAPLLPVFVNLVTIFRKLGTNFKSKEEHSINICFDFKIMIPVLPTMVLVKILVTSHSDLLNP